MFTRKILVVGFAPLSLGLFADAAQANLIGNGGFETPDASGVDVNNAPGAPWAGFNDPNLRFTTSSVARSGSQSLKVFGPFDGIGGGVGATQQVAIGAGQTFTFELYALNNSLDPIQGNNFALGKVELFNSNGQWVEGPNGEINTPLLGWNLFETNQINASSTQDEWQLLGTGGLTPTGTATANIVIVAVQLGDGNGQVVGGSTFFDDASLVAVPEPGSMALIGLGSLALMRRRRHG